MSVDAQWGNTVLLLPFSDDLLDALGHVTTASGGAALSSAVGNPFGAGNALYCDGTNDRLTATSADFTLGTGDFSIQFWFYSVDGGHGANYGRLLTIGLAQQQVACMWSVLSITTLCKSLSSRMPAAHTTT